jgi:hypothetical protein
VLLGGATGARPLRREERSKPRPVLISQFVSSLRTQARSLPRLCKHTLGRIILERLRYATGRGASSWVPQSSRPSAGPCQATHRAPHGRMETGWPRSGGS